MFKCFISSLQSKNIVRSYQFVLELNQINKGHSESNTCSFHGNCIGCREYNNLVGQRNVLATKQILFFHSHCHRIYISQPFLFLWVDNCAEPPKTWLVIQIAVAIDEMHYPPHNCARIHCLVLINVYQTSRNISRCNFILHG